MRVSINKLTGKLIEYQSGGETHPDPNVNDEEYALTNLDTLRQNAIRTGHLEKNIEVKFVTDEEYQAILDVIPKPKPTEEQLNEEKISKKTRELAIDALKEEGKLPVDYK